MSARLIMTKQALALLAKEVSRTSLRGTTRRLEMDAGNLHHVLAGQKDPEYALRRFGYRRVIKYQKVRQAIRPVPAEEDGK